MRHTTLGVCLHVDDVAATSRFYVDLLGFVPTVNLGWFVSLRHPDQATIDLCVVQREHAATPAVAGPVRGVVLAFLVEDVAREFARLNAAGAAVALAPRDEPWGQRRGVVLDPAGSGIELVQTIAPDPAWLAEHLGGHGPGEPAGGHVVGPAGGRDDRSGEQA